jgi:P4 family phage/plasmid primase-like protien
MEQIKRENYTFLKQLLKKPEEFFKENRYEDLSAKACFSEAYKKYGFLESWESALTYLCNLPKNKNVFNELIFGNMRVKPYLDIEWIKEDNPDLQPEEVIYNIKKNLVDIFEEIYQYKLDPNDILVASCNRKKNQGFKYSYHIVVSTTPTVVYENSNQASFLVYELKRRTNYPDDLIDLNPYKKTQNLRMLYHCKDDEYIPFIPNEATRNGEADLAIALKYLVTNTDKSSIVLKGEEQADEIYKRVKANTIPSDDELLQNIDTLVKAVHPTAKFDKLDRSGFLQYNYEDRSEPCFTDDLCERTHENLGFWVFLKGKEVWAGCHSGNCTDMDGKKIIKLLGTLKSEEYQKEFKKVDLNESFEISPEPIIEAINNGPRGLSQLFLTFYIKPQRIKWSNQEMFLWNGRFWEKDDYDFLESLIPQVLVQVLRKFTGLYVDDDTNTNKITHVIESHLKKSYTLIDALNKGMYLKQIIKWVTPQFRDLKFVETRDVHPHYLAVKNGFLDLLTGDLRNTLPEDNITQYLDIDYNPDADDSLFENFVREITGFGETKEENEELYNYIRWMIGYSVQGEPSKKLFFILYGPNGFNGKSLFINTISDVLGYYSTAMDASVVLDGGGKKTAGAHSTELMQLQNKRLGILNDIKEGSKLDDGKVKMLTGQTDKISGRQIYKEQQEFIPKFVPFINTNHRVKMDLTDDAMYQRLVLIPFKFSFVSNPNPDKPWERKGDDSLNKKFTQNKEGILKWIVECSKMYAKIEEVKIPDILLKAKEDYRIDMSIHIEFISKNFIKRELNKEYFVPKTKLLSMFKLYCQEIGERFDRSTAEEHFNKLLTIRKIQKSKSTIAVYDGLEFKPLEDDPEEQP